MTGRYPTMAKKSIEIDSEVAMLIKERRKELGLTIESAAKKAGVGTKTWSRYESGGPISEGKVKGVCNALKWSELPDYNNPNMIYGKFKPSFDGDYYKNHKYWSKFIENCFGEIAATSFVMGAELLFDCINMDMSELKKLPKGSHIGQIYNSWLEVYMPEQFLIEYDYDFLFHMRSSLKRLCEQAEYGKRVTAHSVIDELILMIMVMASEDILEEDTDNDDWKDWIFDLMDDADTEFYLYSDNYVEEWQQFHFSHWFEDVFWME